MKSTIPRGVRRLLSLPQTRERILRDADDEVRFQIEMWTTELMSGASRALSAMLFGVSATDPTRFASITIIIAAIALLASYLPERRARRIDPVEALRME